MSGMNHLEIYAFLQKSNCRQCQFPTCLAFAAAVMMGEGRLSLCPHLESNVVEQIEKRLDKGPSAVQEDLDRALKDLRRQILSVDFPEASERLGASLSDDALTVRCLSKNFTVDSEGNVRSDCHTTPRLIIPLLNYILRSAGKNLSGRWVLLRELHGGANWSRLFGQRCEKPLKRLIDAHTDLFEDIIDIFGGSPMEDISSADVSIVIHPLPKVPILIRYWYREGDFDSILSLLFDATAGENLNIDSLYLLCVGLVTMFERIVLTHGKSS